MTGRSVSEDLSWCHAQLAEAVKCPRTRGIEQWIEDVLMEECLLRRQVEEGKE